MASKTSRTFVWIILGLVMVGLVGFGSTNFGGTVRSIGTVGDTEIDAGRYFRELNGEFRAFQAATGQPITMAQAQAFGLDQQVLGRLIATVAMENETARLGVSVGDAEISRQVVQIEAFQGVDGSFDRDAYEFALQQSGMTASEFETGLRAEVSRTILQSAVANGITTSPVYVDTLFDFARESRDFTWAALAPSALETDPGSPDDAALNAYYDANPADFTLPEIRRITYAWLNPEDLIDTIEVDEAALRTLYDERADEYMIAERRLVEQLVFATMGEAQAAADRLAAGEVDFDTLVSDRGLTLSDIDLGDVTQDDLDDAGEVVFALSAPGIAGPAESAFGPALYRMNAILAARETTFDQARDELQAEYAADRARRQVAELLPELDDLLAGGVTLEEMADEQGLVVDRIDWSAGQDSGIAAYQAFREAAGAVTPDDFPELVLTEDGGVFALRLDEIQAPRLQSLDEVRDAAAAGWRAAETTRLLTRQAESYLPRLDGGESLSSLGLTEIVETGQSRDGFVEGTPPDFLSQVYEMAAGDWRIIENTEGVVMVRLDAVNAADHDSAEAQAIKTTFAERSAQEIGVDVEAAFSAALQTQAGIALNQPVINAIHSQFP